MNVFLAQVTKGNMFNITTGTKKDIIAMDGHIFNEAFALVLVDDGDNPLEELIINYKDNFYNLDPNCKYKITTLKIGDTSLSETDISDGDPNIPPTTGGTTYAYIGASIGKDWVKSVYRQCTGKEIVSIEINSENDLTAEKIDALMQSETNGYLGQQIANRLYRSRTGSSEIINNYINAYDTSAFFKTLSEHEQIEFEISLEDFMTSYATKTTGFRTGNLVQNYFNVLKQLQDRYANDTTATSILQKYNPINNIELAADLSPSTDVFKIIYNIDPYNTYGFTSSLGGLAYVLWIFCVYRVVFLLAFGGFTPDEPIISTIPVSITFTNVAQ